MPSSAEFSIDSEAKKWVQLLISMKEANKNSERTAVLEFRSWKVIGLITCFEGLKSGVEVGNLQEGSMK